jgi:hypothetical protein
MLFHLTVGDNMKKSKEELTRLVRSYFKGREPEKVEYVAGRCDICNADGLVLIVDGGTYSLRCLQNLEHINIEGWV